MTMGERLKEERQRIGVNQTVLAEKCGVTKNTQLAYEKGDRNPDTAYLAQAASLGVDILYLVTGERKPVPTDSISAEVAEFLKAYQRVREADREVLFRMVSAFANAAGIEDKGDCD
ncbi:helix-turn-helix domain-containing protein [Pseudomonas sp. NBRC 111138]|uniref:helix-turn-helix domain-containing protein n=1 Tax=Pseudomonas sp. NBRC 111138 TaxID=1661053 RepID=UPI0006D3F7F8|nr:helix-turn-helix transcriptional regulator [Pseudomonas sp. NBRC 111138]